MGEGLGKAAAVMAGAFLWAGCEQSYSIKSVGESVPAGPDSAPAPIAAPRSAGPVPTAPPLPSSPVSGPIRSVPSVHPTWQYSAQQPAECVNTTPIAPTRAYVRSRSCVLGGSVVDDSQCSGPSLPSREVLADISCGLCGGAGTLASPYLICTADQLNLISRWDTAPFNKHFRLAADIDMNTASLATSVSTSNFVPLPTVASFDGNNRVIRNLRYVDASAAPRKTSVGFVDVTPLRYASWAVRDLRFQNATYRLGDASLAQTQADPNWAVSGLLNSPSPNGKDIVNIRFDGLTIEVLHGTASVGGVHYGSYHSGEIRDVEINGLNVRIAGTVWATSDAGGLMPGSVHGTKISNVRVGGVIDVGGRPGKLGGILGDSVLGGQDGILGIVSNCHADVRLLRNGAPADKADGGDYGAIVGGWVPSGFGGRLENCTYNQNAVPGLSATGR